MINARMRQRTGEAPKHQALGTFCVAFFPEAGSSLIVFCAVTPTCGCNRRCRAGPGAPGRASGRSQAPWHGGPSAPGGPYRLVPLPGHCRGTVGALPCPPAGNPRAPGSAPSLRGTRVPPAGTARSPPVTAATSARGPPPIGWAGGREAGTRPDGRCDWLEFAGAGRGAGRARSAPGRLPRERPRGRCRARCRTCGRKSWFDNEEKNFF